MAYVYVVECLDGTYYVGSTSDIERRLLQHQGKLPGGSEFVKEHGYKALIWSQEVTTTDEALVLENDTANQYRLRLGDDRVSGGVYLQHEDKSVRSPGRRWIGYIPSRGY